MPKLELAVARWPGSCARPVSKSVTEPYVTPGVVLAMAMIFLYLRPLPMTSYSLYNTLGILLLAYLARLLTKQLRSVVSGFRQFPRELLEAAETAAQLSLLTGQGFPALHGIQQFVFHPGVFCGEFCRAFRVAGVQASVE